MNAAELITDAMVEAAAAASYDSGIFVYDLHCPVWGKLTPLERDEWLVGARAALEATAPVIAARALRDAARNLATWNNKVSISAGLTSRADAIERGEP